MPIGELTKLTTSVFAANVTGMLRAEQAQCTTIAEVGPRERRYLSVCSMIANMGSTVFFS